MHKLIIQLLALLSLSVVAIAKDDPVGGLQLGDASTKSAAFKAIDKYLDETVGNRRIEENLDLLTAWLLRLNEQPASQRPADLLAAISSLLLLKPMAEEKKCDGEVVKVLSLISAAALTRPSPINGTDGDDDSKLDLFDGHVLDRLPRVRAIVGQLVEKLVKVCEPQVEHQLIDLIGPNPSNSSNTSQPPERLFIYLSEPFIVEWDRIKNDESFRSLALGRMNLLLDWSEWRRNATAHRLMLGQLFDSAEADLSDRDYSHSVFQEYSQNKWPKVNKLRLTQTIEKWIHAPCINYVKLTRTNVFELHYLSAQILPNYQRRFVGKRSREFILDLFRYEFCRFALVKKNDLIGEMWLVYRLAVYPNMIFGDMDRFKEAYEWRLNLAPGDDTGVPEQLQQHQQQQPDANGRQESQET